MTLAVLIIAWQDHRLTAGVWGLFIFLLIFLLLMGLIGRRSRRVVVSTADDPRSSVRNQG